MSDDATSAMVYCRDCGAEIRARAEICPECGIRQRDPEPASGSDKDKDPGLAAVASFLIPGLGQVYNGQIGKGIVAGIITVTFAITGIGLIVAIPIWIWLVYDAYKTADRMADDSSSGAEPAHTGDRPEVDDEDPVHVALDWYQRTSSSGRVGHETLRKYNRGTDLQGLPRPHMNFAVVALEKYQEAHGEDPELQAIVRELKARYDYEGDDTEQSTEDPE